MLETAWFDKIRAETPASNGAASAAPCFVIGLAKVVASQEFVVESLSGRVEHLLWTYLRHPDDAFFLFDEV